jgi:hypothetical protein
VAFFSVPHLIEGELQLASRRSVPVTIHYKSDAILHAFDTGSGWLSWTSEEDNDGTVDPPVSPQGASTLCGLTLRLPLWQFAEVDRH